MILLCIQQVLHTRVPLSTWAVYVSTGTQFDFGPCTAQSPSFSTPKVHQKPTLPVPLLVGFRSYIESKIYLVFVTRHLRFGDNSGLDHTTVARGDRG